VNRVVSAAVLICEFAFLWFGLDWVLTLSDPWFSFVQVGCDLLIVACLLGIILPQRWAAGFQLLILFVFLLFMISYVPLCM